MALVRLHASTLAGMLLLAQAMLPAAAATFTVSNTNDSGSGSLRWAIEQANAVVGADLINFTISGTGVRTITPATPLPVLSTTITIDGTTQPGFAGTPLIQINGSNAGAGARGLQVTGSNMQIKALTINRFSGAGIWIGGGSNARVTDCWIGLGSGGGSALGNQFGVRIENSGGHTIGPGNTLSGNNFEGVLIIGSNATGNIVRGNRIGTNPAGISAISNGSNGVVITGGASNNLIGGNTSADLNVISGNQLNGVAIVQADANRIERNYVGVNAAGLASLGNGAHGILIQGGSRNAIGSTAPGTFNVVSGNASHGLAIIFASGNATELNRVHRSIFGANLPGTQALANGGAGIRLDQARATLIGSAWGSGGNLISGNSGPGIDMELSHDTEVRGNRIGSDATGTLEIRNQVLGLRASRSDDLLVDDNLISGNGSGGVRYDGIAGVFTRNRIGTTAAGDARLRNFGHGIQLGTSVFDCYNVDVGGAWEADGNLISGNNGAGIYSLCRGFVVSGNRIGTDLTGTTAIANGGSGVHIDGGYGRVGGLDHDPWTCNRECNLLSGNSQNGLRIQDSGSDEVFVQGNFVGTQITGIAALPNQASGISAYRPDAVMIGGVESGAGNLVSGNAGHGVVIDGNGLYGIATVWGNRIGTVASGLGALGNSEAGVRSQGTVDLRLGSADHTAGACDGACNLIAGNGGDGVWGTPSYGGSRYLGNWIGLRRDGTCLANVGHGVRIEAPGQRTLVGGTGAGEGNRIACNGGHGVMVGGDSAFLNAIRGNAIWNNTGLGIDLGNDGVTPNDPGDHDLGPNDRTNFPLLLQVIADGAGTRVVGSYDGVANQAHDLDFYYDASCDASGHGEGRHFMGSIRIDTDDNGLAGFDAVLPVSVAQGQRVTATATPVSFEAGSSSEFSACRAVSAPPQPGTLAFGSATYSVGEGGGSVVLTVVRSGGTAAGVGITYATANGSATAPADYAAQSGNLSFGAGEASKTISIPIVGDALHEISETFSVSLSNPTGGAALGSPSTATVTILDNDPTPTLSVDTGGCSVTEGNTGSTTCNFVFRLSALSGRSTTFSTATANGTAIAGSDYSGHASTARSIPAGQATLTVAVPVLGDSLHEASETFSLNASSVIGATPGSLSAIGTITDNDTAPTLSVDNGGCTVSEGNAGSSNCSFVFRLSTASGRTTTFNTATASGTAIAGSDFTGHASTARSLAAGQTTLTVAVPVLGDTLHEATETLGLNASSVVGASPGSLSATGTITDNDPAPTLSVDNGGCSVTEGNPGSSNCDFVYRLSAASGLPVSFNSATSNGTASAGSDYTGHTGTARSIVAGQTTLTVAVPVLGDILHEATETFTLNASSVAGASPGSLDATGTITDNDPAPTLSVDNGGCSVTEGDAGSTTCNFVMRLSAVSGLPVNFQTATSDGTANAGGDYTGHGATSRSIAAGQTSLSVAVPVLGDSEVEPDETFSLLVTDVVNAAPASLAGNGIIMNDDTEQSGPGVLILSPAQLSLSEVAGPATLTVLRSGGSQGAVSVNYATVDGSALAPQDYLTTTGTLHFADGQTSQNVQVALIDDALHELTESFSLVLSNPTGGASLGSPASSTISLIDSDPAPVLTIDKNGCSVIEGDSGSAPCRFVLRLSRVSGRSTGFLTATLDDTAEDGLDYLGHTTTARSIAAGQASLTLDVPVLGDTELENDEQFFLLVEQVEGATPDQLQGNGVILDDDLPPDADLIFRSSFEKDEAL